MTLGAARNLATPQGSAKTRARNARGRRVRALQKKFAVHAEHTTICQSNLCPTYHMNRLLRIVALSDIFKRHGLWHLEGLLKNTWSFLEEAPIWQFECNDGRWADCEVDVQKVLQEAWALRQHTCTVRAETWCYSYNMIELLQLNLSTGRARRIRCHDPFCSTLGTPRQTDTSEPKWQFQCGHGWANCDANMQVLLEGARQNEQETLTVPGPAGFMLQVDLQNLTQTNTQTGRVRQLRRCVM